MNSDWVDVESSAIDAVAYDDGSLYIRWTDGASYVYSVVPRSTFEALLAADSIGTYANTEIKPHYDCRKL